MSKVGPNEILITKAHFWKAPLLNVKHLETAHFYQSKILGVTYYTVARTPPHPLPLLGNGGGGWLSHFSKHLYRRDLGQIRILGEKWHFRWGWFFSRCNLKTPCIKNSEYESQAKKFSSHTLTNFWQSLFVVSLSA